MPAENESNSRFLFAACQPGAERALKHEVETRNPGFRFSYSRPGFVTFKVPADKTPMELLQGPCAFARTRGLSLGKVTGDNLGTMAEQVWALSAVVELKNEQPITDIHVWQRDSNTPGKRGFEPGSTQLAETVEETLRDIAPKQGTKFLPRPVNGHRLPSRSKKAVLDVVLVEPGEWWIGWHPVVLAEHCYPGGVMPLDLPDYAISRAYLKMAEALRWSKFPLEPGDEWVEVGCAPGGASQALLDREQFVTGIDPAEVDETVLKHERFRHLKMRGSDVRRNEFRDVNWLAADVNATPSYTLDLVEDIVTSPHANIRGMVLTFKLTDWSLAENLSEFIARIRSWGFRDIRPRQLAFNGQELCIVALRNRAQRRLRRESRTGRSKGVKGKLSKRTESAKKSRPIRRIDLGHSMPPAPHL